MYSGGNWGSSGRDYNDQAAYKPKGRGKNQGKNKSKNQGKGGKDKGGQNQQKADKVDHRWIPNYKKKGW